MTPEQKRQRHVVLAERFVGLADTLVADFDVVELLAGLMSTCQELLPVDQSGLLLLDPQGQLQRVASSSEETRLMELLQAQTREGPCFESARTGTHVLVDDIAAEHERWPTFTERALLNGFRSVYAFPMRLREATLGSLNLFGTRHASLDADDQVIAQSLADVATIAILQQRSLLRSNQLAESLQRALNTRIVVEQAKGVLAERGRVPMEETFDLLRAYARSHHLKISDLAHDVVYPPHLADAVLAHTPRDSGA